MKYTLKNILIGIFSSDQLMMIPRKLRDKEIFLSEVDNIEEYISACEVDTNNFKTAGEHRLQDWEKGWGGDGVYYSDDEYNNLPYYFVKNRYLRLKAKVYLTPEPFVEVDCLRALQSVVFSESLPFFTTRTVIEYGCGTGCNIQYLREIFPYIEFFGTDWAKSAVQKLIENNILDNKHAYLVDYFIEETFKDPNKKFIALTNASLEQTGNRYNKFIDYLVGNSNCSGGIHIEPIGELLDLSNPLNKQSYE